MFYEEYLQLLQESVPPPFEIGLTSLISSYSSPLFPKEFYEEYELAVELSYKTLCENIRKNFGMTFEEFSKRYFDTFYKHIVIPDHVEWKTEEIDYDVLQILDAVKVLFRPNTTIDDDDSTTLGNYHSWKIIRCANPFEIDNLFRKYYKNIAKL